MVGEGGHDVVATFTRKVNLCVVYHFTRRLDIARWAWWLVVLGVVTSA